MYISHTCLGSLDCTTTNKIYFDYSSTTLGAKVNTFLSSVYALAAWYMKQQLGLFVPRRQGKYIVLALASWLVQQQIGLFIYVVTMTK
jgi:hypothetical protein